MDIKTINKKKLNKTINKKKLNIDFIYSAINSITNIINLLVRLPLLIASIVFYPLHAFITNLTIWWIHIFNIIQNFGTEFLTLFTNIKNLFMPFYNLFPPSITALLVLYISIAVILRLWNLVFGG